MFSADGTVKRLGSRDSGTLTGRQPLRNANKSPADPVFVTLRWRDELGKSEATRYVTNARSEQDPKLRTLFAKAPGLFIIRGHDLRKFVESTTPTDRYKECAEFLGASRLSLLQDDLYSLKYQITQADRAKERRAAARREVQRVLGESLDPGNDIAVKAWIDRKLVAAGLSPTTTISTVDPAIESLRDRAAEERTRTKLADLEQIISYLDDLLADDDGPKILAPLRQSQQSALKHAALVEASANAQRHDVLSAAISYLKRDDVDTCPVCETPLTETKSGSRAALLDHLEALQRSLAELSDASRTERIAKEASIAHRENVATTVADMKATLRRDDLETIATELRSAYDACALGDNEPILGVIEKLKLVRADAFGRAETARAMNAPTAGPLLQQVLGLIQQREAWLKIASDTESLKTLRDEIETVSVMVNAEVRKFLESNVSALGKDTAKIYNRIQQGAPVTVTVSLRLVAADAADTRKMEMVLDFPTVGDTKPQGYLSDSQLNTLALAFRVAIARRFNPEFPFLILDDVFTSHDAEFRDQAAEMIANELPDVQLLVMTHDDLFARLVQRKVTDRRAEGKWKFLRIATFDLEKGPRFIARQMPEERLIARWDAGEPNGGDLRSWVEEWLENLSRQLGAQFTMRQPTRAHNYAHAEMAEAIRDVLRSRYDMDKVMASIPEFSATISEIVGAVIENEGAHHHDNPYASSDAALEQRFFARIKRLQRYFVCNETGCGGKLGYDERRHRAICQKANCGHVFELKADTW